MLDRSKAPKSCMTFFQIYKFWHPLASGAMMITQHFERGLKMAESLPFMFEIVKRFSINNLIKKSFIKIGSIGAFLIKGALQ